MYISHIYSLSKRLKQLKLICLLVSMLIFIQLQFIHNYMTVKLGKMFQKFVMNSKMNPRVETISLSYLRRISFHIYVSVSLYLRNSTILDAVIHHSSPYSWLKYIFFKLLTVVQTDSFQLPSFFKNGPWFEKAQCHTRCPQESLHPVTDPLLGINVNSVDTMQGDYTSQCSFRASPSQHITLPNLIPFLCLPKSTLGHLTRKSNRYFL